MGDRYLCHLSQADDEHTDLPQACGQGPPPSDPECAQLQQRRDVPGCGCGCGRQVLTLHCSYVRSLLTEQLLASPLHPPLIRPISLHPSAFGFSSHRHCHPLAMRHFLCVVYYPFAVDCSTLLSCVAEWELMFIYTSISVYPCRCYENAQVLVECLSYSSTTPGGAALACTVLPPATRSSLSNSAGGYSTAITGIRFSATQTLAGAVFDRTSFPCRPLSPPSGASLATPPQASTATASATNSRGWAPSKTKIG